MEILVYSLVAFCFVCIIGMALMYNYANKKCRHNWGVVDDKNLQYCDLCGVATKPIEESYKGKCIHHWTTENSSSVTTPGSGGSPKIIGMMYILKCSKCGDMAKRTLSIDGDE